MTGKIRQLNVGFLVSGQGRLFRSAVEHKTDIGIRPALLIAEKKAISRLKAFCKQNKISYIRLDPGNRKKFDSDLTEACINAKLDLIVTTFDKILPAQLVAHYKTRIINVHPGLLPSFKGCRAIPRCVDSGAKYAGASIHEITNDVDGGSIISQCIVSVGPKDTVGTVGKRLFVRLNPMYLQVLAWYADNRVARDSKGRIWVRGADYSDGVICPRIEKQIQGLTKTAI